MTTVPPIEIPDLSDPAVYLPGIPLDAFHELRKRPGLYWQPVEAGLVHGGYWAATRFEDIVAIERDAETFINSHGAAYPSMSPVPLEGAMADMLLVTDPPRHGRLRRAAAAGFGPRVVKNFDPWIRSVIRDVIASVDDLEEFDFVEKFAQTIPAYVVGEIMGMPVEARANLVRWVTMIFAGQQEESGSSSLEAIVRAMTEIREYSVELQTLKREQPGEDTGTELDLLVQKGDLTQQQYEMMVVQLLAAGYETTNTTMAHALNMYLGDAHVRDATNRGFEEGIGARVVDEYVRVISPIIQMARTVTHDTEVAGTRLRKGDVVAVYYTSGNRDEQVFERGNVFDPWRSETETLAFGSGPHRCIGLYVAQLEIRILFEEMFAAGLNLRYNGVAKRGASNHINQILSLPVARVR